MAQNVSSAVMAQRVEARDSLDDFPTPPWATRALFEYIGTDPDGVCREPACNRGHMVRPLTEVFGRVEASDVHDYGAGYRVDDYLFGPPPEMVDWTITNPPFRLAQEFIHRALATSREGVAMLTRLSFLEGQRRWQDLFRANEPDLVLVFSERVVMHRGRLAPNGSTATAYCWLVWGSGHYSTRLGWIEPGSRARFERDGDYPADGIAIVDMEKVV